jgi:hypothetical protein
MLNEWGLQLGHILYDKLTYDKLTSLSLIALQPLRFHMVIWS